MSYRFDSPLHASGYQFGFRGLGLLASLIPSSGADGPGFGYPSIEPDDAGAEVQFLITSFPSGAFFANEDTSFSYSGPSSSLTFQKKVNGLAEGTAAATFNVGAALVSADLAITYAIDAQQLVSADLALTYAIDAAQLVSADLALSYAILADSPAPPGADLSKVPPSRIVVFEGSGSRIVIF